MTGSSLMDHEELREAARAVLSAESDSAAVRRIMEGDEARQAALQQQMAQLGWFGLTIAEDFGGAGLGFAELSVLHEELGRYLTPVPFMTTLLAAEVIGSAGNKAQRSQWLPSIASGSLMASIVLPQIGGGLRAAGPRGADLRLSGRFEHVVAADLADLLLLPVIDDSGNARLAVISRKSSGVSVEQRPSIDQTRTLCTVTLLDARAPADHVLEPAPHLWNALFDHASVALALDSIGGAGHILEKTVDYLKTRRQFDRPIGSFQALKHRCATWKVLCEAASALTRQAVSTAGLSSSAKFYACDAYAAIAGDAVQLHGGIGFTWEHDCHLFLKRAKLNQALFGTATDHKERAARSLLAAYDISPPGTPS